jgi:hypothetical protein
MERIFGMVVYVVLRKAAENAGFATYAFGPDESAAGRLRLDKATGEVAELRQMLGDTNQMLFMPAAVTARSIGSQGPSPDGTSFSA